MKECGKAASWLLALVAIWLVCAATADAASGNGLLFEVHGKGTDPSYLFGTIHSEDSRVLLLPRPVQEAFDRASGFVMEVIPDSAAIAKSMRAMSYTNGCCLKDVVGAALYTQALEAMKARGMGEVAISSLKPWAVVALLSLPPAKTGQFLDLRLYRDALAQGKTVAGLETIEEQLGVFEDLSEQDQVALLRETLSVEQQLPIVFERLLNAYLASDLDKLLSLSERYLQGGDSALAERFRIAALDRRNRRMAERLRPLFEKGGYFVAVGALHLPGKEGVLNRLLDSGFSVRRVY